MVQKTGTTGAVHAVDVAAVFLRATWSDGVRRPGQKAGINAFFKGVEDGAEVELEIYGFSAKGGVKAKDPPAAASVKAGRVSWEWTVELEGEGASDTVPALLAFMVTLKDKKHVMGTCDDTMVVARFGAVLQSVDECFCPAVESLRIKYRVEDPVNYIRSGLLRVYGNQVDGASYPDKKAVVYERLLTPREFTAGIHTVEWQGYANVEKGPFAPAEKGHINYAHPLHSPYLVQIELLDRVHKKLDDWPSDDALPSCPDPLKFQGITLKEGNSGFETAGDADDPIHCGFEIVYAGLEIDATEFVAEADEASTGNKKYQNRLNELGYFCGPVDGIVGKLTKQGIHEFKRNHWEIEQYTDDAGIERYRPDKSKPLGGHDALKIKSSLDKKTKAAIDHASQGRIWSRLVSANGIPVPDGENRIPRVGEFARIEVDGNIVYQKPDEFWSNRKGKATVKKQDREGKWMPRPWVPFRVRPLLKRRNNSTATADASRYGAGPARFLVRAIDPLESHAGLDLPDGSWPAQAPKPFTNYDAYLVHKRGQPERYVNAVVADTQGDVVGDFVDDNAPQKIGKKKNYGVRSKDGKQRASEALQCGKFYRYKPWKAEILDDPDNDKDKAMAVSATPSGGLRGEARFFFVPSIIAGDNYRIEARLDLSKDGEGRDLENSESLVARYAASPVTVSTGTMTVWRRIEFAEYLYLTDATARPTDSDRSTALDWDRLRRIYRHANIDLVASPDEDGRRMTEAEYQALVAEAYPKLSPDEVTFDRGEFYPRATMPLPAQKKREGSDDYLRRISKVLGDHHTRMAKACHRLLRRRHRTGPILIDFLRNTAPFDVRLANKSVVQRSKEFSSGQAQGVLLLLETDPDDGAYVVAHELGHSLYLYHWHNAGEDNEDDHDNGDDYCVMMYPDDDEVAEIAPDFCGKCLLKLRGWNEKALPRTAP